MKKYLIIFSFLFFALQSYALDAYTEHVEIQGSKGKLYGILQYPAQVKDDVKYPLVIICHGFNGNCDGELEKTLSADLNEAGMAALRFDFNGHGKSEGEFKDMTVPNEIEDLKYFISWAQEKKWVESIALIGHSQGGVVVSMTAGELGDSIIKAEVLLAPAAVLKEDAIRGNTMGARYNPWNLETEYVELPSFGGGPGLQLGRDYIITAVRLPIYETARNYMGPSLIIHGTHDFVVPFTFSERYAYELKNSELKLIEGDNHMFTESLKETCQYVTDWLTGILKPAPVEPVKI